MVGLFDKMLTAGLVTDVRAWQPATMFEVDIHLPTIDMEKWDTIKRPKCRVYSGPHQCFFYKTVSIFES